jgi:hypothetical protein|mmetsp:Transcript_70961/g.118657  ORF Transcript_70961/g.118657 Transcript_70961/m.118657 type:complete len:278 (-) Transcript_70961:185-1018(-)
MMIIQITVVADLTPSSCCSGKPVLVLLTGRDMLPPSPWLLQKQIQLLNLSSVLLAPSSNTMCQPILLTDHQDKTQCAEMALTLLVAHGSVFCTRSTGKQIAWPGHVPVRPQNKLEEGLVRIYDRILNCICGICHRQCSGRVPNLHRTAGHSFMPKTQSTQEHFGLCLCTHSRCQIPNATPQANTRSNNTHSVGRENTEASAKSDIYVAGWQSSTTRVAMPYACQHKTKKILHPAKPMRWRNTAVTSLQIGSAKNAGLMNTLVAFWTVWGNEAPNCLT